jgi:Cys-tRNA(Pro)/Cys-tRNA(Cys) deacylase
MDGGSIVFERLARLVEQSGLAHVVHAHRATRTVDEARANLDFEPERIVKTVAFGLRNGEVVLAALRGTRRVDYARLAALCGVNRRDLRPLSPEEVLARLGVEPGSVSPLLGRAGARVLLDADALGIRPTVYCGLGRPDRTLEMTPDDLLRLCAGASGEFSRP